MSIKREVYFIAVFEKFVFDTPFFNRKVFKKNKVKLKSMYILL